MTEALNESPTEPALFELLALDRRVDSNGTLRYYNSNGERHRVYGPAIEYSDGSKFWYQNGRLHRLDGPAIVCTDGYRAWFQNGQRHRIDGPAVEYEDEYRAWYINGKELTEAEWQQAGSMETV